MTGSIMTPVSWHSDCNSERESERIRTKKESMNVSGLEKEQQKVVPLFGAPERESVIPDPLETLIQETQVFLAEEMVMETRALPVVTENQFPDQSMFTLDTQLSQLKESLGRIKYYLLDLDDLLPK